MARTADNKSDDQNGRMIIKDMSHLEGKVHFPKKLEKAREILAPLIKLRNQSLADNKPGTLPAATDPATRSS